MKAFIYLLILAILSGCKREVVDPSTSPLPINNTKGFINIISLKESSITDKNKNGAVTSITFQTQLVNLSDEKCYINVFGLNSNNTRINDGEPIYKNKLTLKANDTTSFDFAISNTLINEYTYDKISFIIYAGTEESSTGYYDSETTSKYRFENNEADKYIALTNKSISLNVGPDVNANRCYQPPHSAQVSFEIDKSFIGKYKLNLYKGNLKNNTYIQVGTLTSFEISSADNGIVSKTVDIDAGSILYTNGDASYYYSKAELISLNGDSLTVSFTDTESTAFESIIEDTVTYKVNAFSWNDIVDANADGYAKSAKLKFKLQRSDLLNDTLKIKLEARQYGTQAYSIVIDNYEMISINDTISFDVLGAETLTKNFYDFQITIYKYIDEKTYGTSYYSRYPALIVDPNDNGALNNQLFEKYSEDK